MRQYQQRWLLTSRNKKRRLIRYRRPQNQVIYDITAAPEVKSYQVSDAGTASGRHCVRTWIGVALQEVRRNYFEDSTIEALDPAHS